MVGEPPHPASAVLADTGSVSFQDIVLMSIYTPGRLSLKHAIPRNDY
jgi:hypothetical protein